MPFERSPRELRTATELRALAHPLRGRLLEALMSEGPLTATECAERTGESPANCSWHLRQLAKYGFVEESGGGTGRQRPWRAVPTEIGWATDEAGTDFAAATDAVGEVWLDHQITSYRHFLARRDAETLDWRAAATMAQSLVWLTAEELTSVGHEIGEIYLRYHERVDRAARPAGARLVRLLLLGYPDQVPSELDQTQTQRTET